MVGILLRQDIERDEFQNLKHLHTSKRKRPTSGPPELRKSWIAAASNLAAQGMVKVKEGDNRFAFTPFFNQRSVLPRTGAHHLRQF